MDRVHRITARAATYAAVVSALLAQPEHAHGATFRVERDGAEFIAVEPTSGYCVGGFGPAIVQRTAPDANGLLDFRSKLWRHPGGNRAAFIGYWHDSQSGKWWVDSVAVFEDRDEAERFARDLGELAFWDVAAGQEIRLEPQTLTDMGWPAGHPLA